jgi:hypothetical protein
MTFGRSSLDHERSRIGGEGRPLDCPRPSQYFAPKMLSGFASTVFMIGTDFAATVETRTRTLLAASSYAAYSETRPSAEPGPPPRAGWSQSRIDRAGVINFWPACTSSLASSLRVGKYNIAMA